MEKARASGTWIRYSLFDRCRVLRAMERWNRIAETMEEILATLPHRGELDFPYLEYDWLKHAPEGFGYEDELWNRYLEACKETRRIFFDEKGGWTGMGLSPKAWRANDD